MNFNKKFLQILLLFFFTAFGISNTSLTDDYLYKLEADKIIYKNNNNLIVAEGNASAIDKFEKKIFSDKIFYYKDKDLIITEKNSKFTDNLGNKLNADNFVYNIKDKKIEAKNKVSFFEKEGNQFYFDNLIYFIDFEKGYGTKFKSLLNDKSTVEGSFAEFNNKTKIISIGNNDQDVSKKYINIFSNNKNTYTPCEDTEINKLKKTIDQRCPDWSLSTQKTIHDKKSKMVYHYGSLLKIKNVPIFYLPYFSHPDPTVKRKSGFMQPVFKSFDLLGQSYRTPYFWAIDDNKDLLFTPVYYSEENPLFLAEYRNQSERSILYFDTSYTSGYKNTNKLDSNNNKITRSNDSKNHFFFNFLGSYNDIMLDKSDIEINVQRISDKNYLKINQINTQYVKQNISNLKNNFQINSYKNSKKIGIGAEIYENLEKDNNSEKYQYKIPAIDHSDYFTLFNQFFNFRNLFSGNNYGGDSSQLYFANQLTSSSDYIQFPGFWGINNIFKTSIINNNNYNQNILNQKENLNNDLFVTAAIESSYPLIKKNSKTEENLIPKIFTKFTSGSMKNANNESKILNYNDIFSMNRLNSIENPETGASLGYGIEYNVNSRNENNLITKKGTFKIGQILQTKNNNDMPNSSTLKDSKSAFIGAASFLINEKMNINYEYIIDNSLNKILQNSVNAEFKLENNIFSSNYYELREIGSTHYFEGKYTHNFKNDINFLTGIRKNLKDNFTESNFIETNYETDCLKISLNLAKNFYQNEELKPTKTFTFSITLKPFGSPISPNLSSLVN